MLLCPIRRTQLLHFLPKGGEGAEIGVAKGEFSQSLLEVLQPRKLHLIDPWEHQTRDDYAHDGNNASAEEQEQRYRAVRDKYAAEIDAGRIELHRAYSQDVAGTFADGQLDWVYIDGLHSYDGCRADLQNYKAKVKPGGFIFGHDYTNHSVAQQMDFGVVEAVDEFVQEENFAFVALTQEVFPTYVLARSLELPAVQSMIANLLYQLPSVIEMRDYPANAVFVHKIVQFGDTHKAVFSF
jgi:hypothetical protein